MPAFEVPTIPAEMEAVIREAMERQYLGEVQRLQDGLHKIREAEMGTYFSYDADSQLLDTLKREYVRDAASALLAGQPAPVLNEYMQKVGITLIKIEPDELDQVEGRMRL